MLSGNKGEWSEIYVFLKLLADGRLNAADENLNALENIYYPIIKVIRAEVSRIREYSCNGVIRMIDGKTSVTLLELPISDFMNKAKELFEHLQTVQGSSFKFPEIESFLKSIDVSTLSSPSSNKSDITLIVHDLKTGIMPRLGFSIKSMLGQNSTLFNPGKTTNFIYRLKGRRLTPAEIIRINSINTKSKIKNRIQELYRLGCNLQYEDIESKILKLNLQLIDSDLPQILGHMLLFKYTKSVNGLTQLLEELKQQNPLAFDLTHGHPFYEYKVKSFLTDSALGMTPATIWKGNYDATGGIIIVKENGDVVCYHIYNRNEFQNYLLKNTKLDQASMNRYKFGEVYEENNFHFLKLNLQVRFN
jgi:type II restriction enzyme